MIVAAFILGVLGLCGLIACICIGVYIAYRPHKPEIPIANGLYRIKTVGTNKLTGAPIYDFEKVDEVDTNAKS